MPAKTTTQNPRSDYIENIRIHMDGTPGEVQIEMTISAHSESEIVDNLTGGPGPISGIGEIVAGAAGGGRGTWEVEVDVNQRRFGEVKGVINDVVNGIASQAGIGPQMILQDARNTSGGFNVSPFSRSINISNGETKTINSVVRFQPIVIPVPQDVSAVDMLEDRLGNRMPNISFTFTMPHDTTLTTIQETYSVDVPLEAFIEEKEIDVSCDELYGELRNRINSLQDNIPASVSGAKQAANDITSQANRVLEMAGMRSVSQPSGSAGGGIGGGLDVGSPLDASPFGDTFGSGMDSPEIVSTSSEEQTLEQLTDRIENVDSESILGGQTSVLQRVRSRVEQIDTREGKASDFRNTINQLRNRVNNEVSSECIDQLTTALDTADTQLESLESLSNSLAELKSALLDVLSGVESISCGEVYSQIDSEVRNLESTIGVGGTTGALGANISADRFESLNSRLNDIENRINDEVPIDNPCRGEFTSRINDMRSALQRVGEEFRGRIELSCADIPNLRSEVASFEGAVESFVSKDQLARTPEDREELISESDDLLSSVRQEASDDNPCKQQLLNRINRSVSRLRRAPARPRTAIPCDQRFESVGQSIESFEEQILNLSAPISPEQVQSIAEEGSQLVEEIEENIPADSDCRVEMSERVRNLTNRAESLTAQIRIEREEETDTEKRRQELIQQLLGSIDTLQNTTESVEDLPEQVDGTNN